jgi:oligopeptide transport system ATP-binding protein
MMTKNILEIKDLKIAFKTFGEKINAIRGINLTVAKGETVAIVGESGSGKSVTVKAIMGNLTNNQVIEGGQILFSYTENGKETMRDLLKISKKEMRKEIKGKRISMVFQDPMTSLNPTMTIGKQILEAIYAHNKKISRKEANERVKDLLSTVGINHVDSVMKAYPHQLSGGMRQRIVIAIAISCEPELLICDEPTTALDVTIQSKILDLIRDIQEKRNLSVIFITHDLGVVSRIADRVNVLYAGKIIESGSCNEIFYNPKHPYTWGLMQSTPDINSNETRLSYIPGTPKQLIGEITGDPFAPRNQYALTIDYRLEPPMFKVNDEHWAATWTLDPKAPKVDMPEQLKSRIDQMKEYNKKMLTDMK